MCKIAYLPFSNFIIFKLANPLTLAALGVFLTMLGTRPAAKCLLHPSNDSLVWQFSAKTFSLIALKRPTEELHEFLQTTPVSLPTLDAALQMRHDAVQFWKHQPGLALPIDTCPSQLQRKL